LGKVLCGKDSFCGGVGGEVRFLSVWLEIDEDFGVFELGLWGIRNLGFWGWGG